MKPELVEAATKLVAAGFAVTVTKKKEPYLTGWQKSPIHPDNPPPKAADADGIAVILGLSNLIDVEGETPDADAVLRALLPGSGMVWEHADRQHRLYRYSGDAPKSIKFEKAGECIIEFRAGGRAATCPPSAHPDGQPYRWVVEDYEPADLDAEQIKDLERRTRLAAVATYLIPFWTEGVRNDLAMATSGYLRHSGVPIELAHEVMGAICDVAEDDERLSRFATTNHTYGLPDGSKIVGLPRLEELTDKDTADAIAKAMGQVRKELKKQAGGGGGGDGDERESDANKVYEAFKTDHKVVRDENDRALIEPKGLGRLVPVNSGHGSAYLYKFAQRLLQKVVTSTTISTVQAALAADAYSQPRTETFLRCAYANGLIWIDLGTAEPQFIAIDNLGWKIVEESPVPFRYSHIQRPLPAPKWPGDLTLLRKYVNADTDDDWTLIVGWLLKAYYPVGTCPLLALFGPQGAGKSTTARVLKKMVDPATIETGTKLERDTRDFIIRALHEAVIVFDNVTTIADDMAEDLCRSATGTAMARRALYTDGDLHTVTIKRSVILNGIEASITASDLLDRTVMVELAPFTNGPRRDEAEFWRAFEADQPSIFAGILNILSAALNELPNVPAIDGHRMVDFVKFVTAAEKYMGWTPGTFDNVYGAARSNATADLLDDSPIARLIVAIVERRLRESKEWEPTATAFYEIVEAEAGEALYTHHDWPASSATLGKKMNRYLPHLNAAGIKFTKEREGSGKRAIRYRFTRA